MTENFIAYLWQFQQFDKTELRTTQGEVLQIFKTGLLNTHSGADFQDVRLTIGNVEWVGSVEFHLKSSDWHTHAHTHDRAYESVVLHVVWQHDQEIHRTDGTAIPTLELVGRTDSSLMSRYEALMSSKDTIPCQRQFAEVDNFLKLSMLDKVLLQRLEQKAAIVQNLLIQTNHDWEETAYQLLARNFGFKINAEPFEQLAKALPLKVLQKHRNDLTQIEALVFGVAGFLDESPIDGYQAKLQQEFKFLSAKYNLANKTVAKHQWKFLRLRPANFPTVRLAQFARLIQENANIFSAMLYLESVKNFVKLLKVKQSDYWQKHYVFGKDTEGKVASVGTSAAENVVINTVVPLLVAYAQAKDNRSFLDKALRLLEELPAEENHITEFWKSLGQRITSSFDSQASIELYNHFCTQKRCLSCQIGVALLK
jgi:hypothetical protein